MPKRERLTDVGYEALAKVFTDLGATRVVTIVQDGKAQHHGRWDAKRWKRTEQRLRQIQRDSA